MQEWIKQALESGSLSLVGLPAAFLLGLLSSLACSFCTLPFLGAVVGYSGTRKAKGHRAVLFAALFFMLGTIIATVILGSVAGFIGQVAQNVLGKYWKLFAGFVAVFFGLASLKLLPFKLPSRTSKDKEQPQGLFGAALFGFIVGGGVGICSLPCNPGIFIVLGVVILKGYNLWAVAILTAYAVGFSLPLAAIMLGVSFGKSITKAKKAETIIRIIAGVLLIVAGFYFLTSI